MNLTDKISEHFTYAEVINSSAAKSLGIDNTLPPIYYGNAINLAKYIAEPIRQHFGEPYSPLSWYRCPALNDAIKGSKTSDHMKAIAMDLKLKKFSLMALAEYVKDNLVFKQLILEPTWVHVSWDRYDNKMEVLRYEGGKYLPGLV